MEYDPDYELWRDQQDAADGFDGLDNDALSDDCYKEMQ